MQVNESDLDLDTNDLGPLAWVLDELRKSLESASSALRRFVRDAALARGQDMASIDSGQLRIARQHMHQAVGALEMVGLAAPAHMLRAMEEAAQKFVERPELCNEVAASKIERAGFALTEYLEAMLGGKPVSSVALFPQYKEVQELTGADRIHPADLWPVDFRWVEPQSPAVAQALSYDPSVRSRLDQAVLRIVKTADAAAGRDLVDASLALAASQTARQPRSFWKIAAGYFEAVALKLLPADLYVKRAASRVLMQYASLAKGDLGVSDRLAHDLVFFCAQAVPARPTDAPALTAVRAAYALSRHKPVDYAVSPFGRFDPVLLAQARKRIGTAKETWGALSGGDTHKLKGVAEQFQMVGDTLVRLYPPSAALAQGLSAAVDSLVRSNKAPSPELAMEVATSILYLEAAFQDLDPNDAQLAERTARLAQRLAKVVQGGQPEPLEHWVEELYRRVSDRQTMGSVVGELRGTLSELEKVLDQFFRSPQDTSPLRDAPSFLSQMRGVLSVLGLDQASQAVLRMREAVEEIMMSEVDEEKARAAGTFDKLGNNLGALGFLIDMLNYQPTLAKKLFVYDDTLGELKPLMGRETTPHEHDVEAAPEMSAPDGAQAPAAAAAVVAASVQEAIAPAPAAPAAAPTAAAAPAPTPAVAPAPVAAPAPSQAAAAFASEEDDELLEIFLEEAREVVQNGLAAVQALAAEPSNISELTTLRRAFHTLKGSSRMVGLTEFGEAGWAMEQVLNTWLADQKPASEPLRTLATQALQAFGSWVESIATKTDGNWKSVIFRTPADAMRTEQRLLEIVAPAAVAEPAAGPVQPAPAEPAAVIAEAAPVVAEAAPVVAEAAPVVAEAAPVAVTAEAAPVAVAEPVAVVAPAPVAPAEIPALQAVQPEPVQPEPVQPEPVQPESIDLAFALPETVAPVVEAAPVIETIDAPAIGDLSFDLGPVDMPAPASSAAEPAAAEVPEVSVDAAFEFSLDVPAEPEPALAAEPEVIELSAPDAAPAAVPEALEIDFAAFSAAVSAPAEPEPAESTPQSEGMAAVELSVDELPPEFDLDLPSAPSEPAVQPVVFEAAAALETIDFGDLLGADPVAAEPVPALEIDFGPVAEGPDAILAEAPAPVSAEPEPEPEAESVSADDQTKVIGTLRIGIPLYNVYLNEADEWSRRLSTEVGEWVLEMNRRVPDSTVGWAHALAGSSATVGFMALSNVARALEYALEHTQTQAHGTDLHRQAFSQAAEEIRRLLHQFAAGFLKDADPRVVQALQAVRDLELPAREEEESGLDEDDFRFDEPLDTFQPSEAPVIDEPLPAPAVQAIEPSVPSVPSVPVAQPPAAFVPAEVRTAVTAEALARATASLAARSEPVTSAPRPVAAPVAQAPVPQLPERVEAVEVPAIAVVTPAVPAPTLAAEAVIEPIVEPVIEPVIEPVAPVEAVAVMATAPVAAPVPEPVVERPVPVLHVAPPVIAQPAPAIAPVAASTSDIDDGDDDIDVVDAIDPDLFPIFEEEAAELMPKLDAALREWAAHPQQQETRNLVLRALHTLKGSARLAGALRLGELAHRMESEVEYLGMESVNPVDIEALIGRFDVMQGRFETLRATGGVTPTDQEPLAAFEPPAPVAVVAATPVAPVAVVSPPAAPAEDAAATTISPAAEPLHIVPVAMAPAAAAPAVAPVAAAAAPAPAPAPAAPVTALAQPAATSLTATRQAANQAVRVRSQLLDRLVNQAGEVMITRSRLETELRQLRGSLADLTGNLDRLRTQLRDIELQAETQMQSRLAQAKDIASSFDPLEFDRFTRVQELTRMMAESVNDVATVQRNIQRVVENTEDDLIAQARQTRELQRDLLRTRMVEFDSISDRLYRVVRLAAKESGKQVKLDLLGGTIEMDRGVLDRMTAAFEHLLRNCVAHGIEDPALRVGAGKEAVGRVVVRVSQEGNDVSVQFEDDGAGLNLPRIREKAIQQGLITADQQLSESEAANLIFRPGFSTATQVTELAGRGIGMDVVRTEITALGGRIETTTRVGQGSTFKLVLPLTTAVTQVVMVRAGKLSVGVPANLVELVRRATAAELEEAYRSGQFQFGGEQLPFFWSGGLLQSSARSTEQAAKTYPVAIFRSAAQRVAVHLDEVLGNQEVVVKNLGPQLSRLPGLAGMTVLASGAVVLIYNPVALGQVYGDRARQLSGIGVQPVVESAAQGASEAQPSAQGQQPAAPVPVMQAAPEIPLVMVVDDSITVRRVTQRLLQREGYRVSMAADGLQALERLAEERPAVVLSDIEMPRMDGFDLARNIRADERWVGLPIIMITSRIAEKHREHAMELGVNHYLGKPYSEEELLGLVKEYCRGSVPA